MCATGIFELCHRKAELQIYFGSTVKAVTGWDESNGIPQRETLTRLGLGWVADQFGV